MILNQRSGQGQSQKIFKEKTEKKLRAKYELEVFKASGGKEAYRYIKAHKNLESFSGILGFGGDGTQNKILKSLLKRNMLDKLPLGVIPTGSGNALASCLFEEDKRKEKVTVSKL